MKRKLKQALAASLAALTMLVCAAIPVHAETPSGASDSSGASAVSAYEQTVARLVNLRRAEYGLSPLTLRSELCACARVKSEDMRANAYFSHTSPTYGSPFEMMRSMGLSYTHAGENIAMGYFSPEAVVDAWMRSASHRANILSASYASLGVGYVADGGYWTQWFLG